MYFVFLCSLQWNILVLERPMEVNIALENQVVREIRGKIKLREGK